MMLCAEPLAVNGWSGPARLSVSCSPIGLWRGRVLLVKRLISVGESGAPSRSAERIWLLICSNKEWIWADCESGSDRSLVAPGSEEKLLLCGSCSERCLTTRGQHKYKNTEKNWNCDIFLCKRYVVWNEHAVNPIFLSFWILAVLFTYNLTFLMILKCTFNLRGEKRQRFNWLFF